MTTDTTSNRENKLLQFGLWGAVGCLVGAVVGEIVLLLLMPPVFSDPTAPQVDVIFLLDVTGSMQAEIDGVRDGILDFADQLSQRDLDARIGLIAFRDVSAGESPQLLRFDDAPFTKELGEFREQVSRLRATGGGDEAESSLDAVLLATEQPFRESAERVLLLITDAPPHPLRSQIPETAPGSHARVKEELSARKVGQLHLVVPQEFLPSFSPLQDAAPGEFFSLDDGRRQSFASVLPVVGQRIAERTIGSLNTQQKYAAASLPRLLAAISGWTACLALGVSLALIAGQNRYLRRPLLGSREALAGVVGGLAAGLLGGLVGQISFVSTASGAVLDFLGRVLGWAVLGALVGRGMAFFVPNLDPKRVMLFGALGGSAGAAGYYFAGALLSDAAGRFLGAALLGLFLGLAVALVELAFRHAWLEVRFGEKEVIRVSLGQRPVRIGGDARHCTVYAAGARAITAEYRLQNGEVQCTDFATERTRPVRAGDQQKIGKLTVTVCTGNAPSVPLGAAAARMPPPPPATRRPDPAPSGAGPPALGVGRPAAAERAGDSLPNQGSGVRLPAEPARSVSSSAKTPPPPPPPKRK